ncbi:MAG: MXAN_2561 family MXYO-CTERM-anchored protein [Hyalangium sp.]|uniref:MXAN_2561 family MXYO-CTERM-anchored protein n=1 Tax=Hyalangium sp. TaxID=2028555 RepID=UPI00389A46AA
MRYLLIALTLTATTAAWSQTASPLQISLPGNQLDIRLKKGSCDEKTTVTWTYNLTTTVVCDDLHFWLAESCTDEVPSGTTPVETVSKANVINNRTGAVSFTTNDLPLFQGGTTTCPADGQEKTYKLCGSVPTPGGIAGDCSTNSKNFQKASIDVTYDAKPPDAPTIDKVAALDQALSVHVSSPSDASRVKVHVARADGSDERTSTQAADLTLFKMDGLENGVTYTVTATALDAADNESAASEPLEGTPIHTLGFFDRYVEAQGAETGGCGAAAGGLTGGGVMAVLAFWLSSRRKRS